VTGSWFDDAACKGSHTGLWYANRGEVSGRRGARGNDSEAALVCINLCPVRAECLEHAIATGEKHGTWGGLSPKARRGKNGLRVLASLRVEAA
jgi:WhiB family redox-sensing transcriptional regulator